MVAYDVVYGRIIVQLKDPKVLAVSCDDLRCARVVLDGSDDSEAVLTASGEVFINLLKILLVHVDDVINNKELFVLFLVFELT